MAIQTQPEHTPTSFHEAPIEPAPRVRRGPYRARKFLLTDRDLELLRFIAAHRFVLAAQARAWLGSDRAVAYRRLSGLVGVGLLSYERIFHAQPGCYQVTNGGLAVIDSDLPRPSIDLRCYRHDVDVVWLALAALHGSFGSFDRALSEREMRSHDQQPDRRDERFAIPLGDYAASGRPRSHYPDVLLVAGDGRRVALELELSMKGRRRLESIFIGYGGERRITRVVYFTDRQSIAHAVAATAAACGVEGLVQVRPAAGIAPRVDQPRPDARSCRSGRELA
jgi:hypothetical protein